jgi:hypothetical protein
VRQVPWLEPTLPIRTEYEVLIRSTCSTRTEEGCTNKYSVQYSVLRTRRNLTGLIMHKHYGVPRQYRAQYPGPRVQPLVMYIRDTCVRIRIYEYCTYKMGGSLYAPPDGLYAILILHTNAKIHRHTLQYSSGYQYVYSSPLIIPIGTLYPVLRTILRTGMDMDLFD